ncbi:shikimate 5-dehydrogenase [gamma proteobacterium HTCC5015]|nr:shikimate 5-dehydrogenase [gamma proteobacterium HTCC5015]
MSDDYAVFGHPIEHSLSPQIHHAFAEQTQQALVYQKQLVEPGEFVEAVNAFRQQGGRGLNITVPFKEEAFNVADELSDLAQRAGAVNTLVFSGDVIVGHNTDGLGLFRDLTENHGVDLHGKKLLILGAGGAVRGVIQALLSADPEQLVIANRTESKAHTLAEHFKDLGAIRACGYADLDGDAYDVIINGTSSGLSGELPPLPDQLLNPNATTYDMVYAKEPTAFVRWGREHGAARALDGLGMLVEQAAEAFSLWRGIRPYTAPVIRQLRGS